MLGNRKAQHSFAQIPDVHMARSSFDRSFTAKDTMFFDALTPILCEEIIPGDTMSLTLETFMRLSTPKFPFMDNMYVDYFFFFVPNRLVWDNWEKFNGAQDNPGDTTDYLIPTIESPNTGPDNIGFQVGSSYDHLGIPTNVPLLKINALPFRGMALIWNEWFRDQNLQNSLTVDKGNGPDNYVTYNGLNPRNKVRDYFTSCLPWPQKGPAVDIPATGMLPVVLNDAPTQPNLAKIASTHVSVGGTTLATSGGILTDEATGLTQVVLDPNGAWSAEVDSGLQITINNFRQAMQIQSLLELDARGGTRYIEILRAHFNVVSPDFRLQRPEYLGGGEIRMNVHPIAQTSESTTNNKLGSLAAMATASSAGTSSVGFTKSFVEHGYVLGFAAPRADITYQQGLNRKWSRQTRYDFFWPKLQELGEQAVLNKEIFAQGTGEVDPDTGLTYDEEVFGYQERYAEYRYNPSEIRGQFRSTYSAPLDAWHLAQEFDELPALDGNFIQNNTPTERVLAVTTGPQILADMWFKINHARPMFTYSVPASLGRF